MSVCRGNEQPASHRMDLHEILYLVFLENLSIKLKFHQNLTIITSTVHEDRYTFAIIYCSVVLRTRNVLDNSRREKQRRAFIFRTFFFRK